MKNLCSDVPSGPPYIATILDAYFQNMAVHLIKNILGYLSDKLHRLAL